MTSPSPLETTQQLPTHPDAASGASRRQWLVAGAAVAAGAAGVGVGWWSHQAKEVSGDAALAITHLWGLQFDRIDLPAVKMADLRGHYLLLNFWATWCPPCVEELPLIDRFYKENSKKGWHVLAIAVDQVAAVKTFLGKMPLEMPVAMAGLAGIELSKSLGNLSGGLPFTVVVAPSGEVVHRKMGKIKLEDLLAWSQLAT